MKKLFIIALSIIVIASCKKQPTFVIQGKITNAEADMIYLEKLELSGTVAFDSAKIDKKGNFQLEGMIDYPSFFLLKLNNNKFITMLIDSTEKINFAADYISFSNDYKIEGSVGSQKVQLLNEHLANTNYKLDSINSLINLCHNDIKYKEKCENWATEKRGIINAQIEFSKDFVNNNPFSLTSILAIYQQFNDKSYIIQDLQTIKMAASALNTMYPNSPHAHALYEDTKKMMKNASNLQLQQIIDKYGKNSPDISLPDQNGKEVKLSSYLGKYVLLQFWSVNDATSRTMNPVLKENYKEFHAKGFEIYSVSIDTIKNEWVNAIQEDKLTWINVGDMQGSFSAAAAYNISKIPSNYLLDPEGKIVAKDMMGPTIHNKLSKLLN